MMTSPGWEFAVGQEQLDKLEKLADIFEHVLGISTKISEMEEDPLPQQLARSIPAYLDTLTSHAASLRDRRWPFVVAGSKLQSKLQLASLLLDEDLCSALPETAGQLSTLVTYSERQYAQVVHVDTGVQPMLIENWEGVHEYVRKAGITRERSASKSCSPPPLERVEFLLNRELVKEGFDLLVVPNQLRSDDFTSSMGSFLFDYYGILYVVEVDTNGAPSTDGLHMFLRELVKHSPTTEHPVGASSCIVICLCQQHPRSQMSTGEEHSTSDDKGKEEHILQVIKECWPACDESQVIMLPADADATVDAIARLRTVMRKSLAKAVDDKVNFAFNWLSTYVGRVIHHLRAFLNQCEKSHEERLQTFAEIQSRLQHLTKEADDFFRSLKRELDGKVVDAQVLLRTHLTDDVVLHRLSTWTEDDIPDEQLWQDIDHVIHAKILARIRSELLTWEDTNHFFRGVQPLFIQHFEQKFSGIESQIVTVEAMIARHDSRICLTDLEAQGVKEEQSIGFLPSHLNLNWQQKVLLGVAAPFLIPIALTIMVVGLPILGGMAAKDLITEKLSENRLREYNENRQEYLTKRTCEEVYRFVKSKYLEQFIKSELRPAYRCIHQLQEVVPRQIEADRLQIESLRLDERDAKDVARFYLPLVEIFEHDRQLLSLFRVFHMYRDKLSIASSEIRIPENGYIICDGFRGTIQTGTWKGSRTQSTEVSVKEIRERVDVKSIEEYLLEENACRFQVSPNIVRFLGVTLWKGQLYHVLGSLKCNLRQVLAHAVQVTPEAADGTKLEYLKGKMVDVVRGLDYLHERGWVHFDLSLDTVAIDQQGVVKLTNISCRKIFRVPRDLPRGELYRYSHLPPEVLVDPPAAYTSVSEMYSVGVMMWEMWTGTRAYWDQISDVTDPIDTIDKFVTYIEDRRPCLVTFYTKATNDTGAEDAEDEVASPQAGHWLNQMQKCWCETDRLTTKGFLQVMDELYAASTLRFKEYHFS